MILCNEKPSPALQRSRHYSAAKKAVLTLEKLFWPIFQLHQFRKQNRAIAVIRKCVLLNDVSLIDVVLLFLALPTIPLVSVSTLHRNLLPITINSRILRKRAKMSTIRSFLQDIRMAVFTPLALREYHRKGRTANCFHHRLAPCSSFGVLPSAKERDTS